MRSTIGKSVLSLWFMWTAVALGSTAAWADAASDAAAGLAQAQQLATARAFAPAHPAESLIVFQMTTGAPQTTLISFQPYPAKRGTSAKSTLIALNRGTLTSKTLPNMVSAPKTTPAESLTKEEDGSYVFGVVVPPSGSLFGANSK